MKKILVIQFLFLFYGISFAQPGTYPESFKQTAGCETSAVYMMNEAVHGLLVVQRIFENDNQTLNKYVDQESQRINFYGNEDLPKNVFEDPDHWFYAVTPYEWLESIQTRCGGQKSGLNESVLSRLRETKMLLDEINQMRFTLDDEMRKRDLNKIEEINAVFKVLEKAASQCDQLLSFRNQLQASLPAKISNLKPEQQDLVKTLLPLYKSAEQLILAIRADNEPQVRKQLTALEVALNNFQTKRLSLLQSVVKSGGISGAKIEPVFEGIKMKVTDLIKEAKAYLGDTPFDSKYAAYGRNYYYYNVRLLSLFNKYGKGIVFEMNQLCLQANIPFQGFMELPHYVKIIYPEKRTEVERSMVTTEKVEALPENLRNRRVVKRQQSIIADGLECVLEFSDNQEVDGDIVSINFNGKWIIENHPLTKEAIKIPVLLNLEGENYLLLHAENEGKTPPNTIALYYTLKGQRKKIILNSTTKESEIIQIKPNVVKK